MHMLCIIAFSQMMVVVRIQLHFKLFVSLDQRIDILQRLLCMHIIIRQAVNNQHIACQICCFVQQGCPKDFARCTYEGEESRVP